MYSLSSANLTLAFHLWKFVYLYVFLLFGEKLLYQISIAVIKEFYAVFNKIKVLLITLFKKYRSLLGKPLDICMGFTLL